MISAVDDTHYVNLEFENLDVRIAELNNLAEAIGHSSARETNSMVSSARVIYDRVLNKKNYFEIPPFLCLNEESVKLYYKLFDFEFPALNFPCSKIKKVGFQNIFSSFSTLSYITLAELTMLLVSLADE